MPGKIPPAGVFRIDFFLFSVVYYKNFLINYCINDIIFADEDFVENGKFYNNGTGFKPIGADSKTSFKGSLDAKTVEFDGTKARWEELGGISLASENDTVICSDGTFGE